MNSEQIYKQNIEKYSGKVKQQKVRLNRFAWFRALSFLLGFGGATILFSVHKNTAALLLIFLSIVALGIFVQKFLKTEALKNYFNALLIINENEQKAAQFDFSPFDGGSEYKNPHHNFSFDMDIFGQNSLYQMLNRTATSFGKDRLADILQNPPYHIPHIKKRQKAIHFLKALNDWRQDFQAVATLNKPKEKRRASFMQFSNPQKANLSKEISSDSPQKKELNTVLWKVILIILPAIALILLAMVFAGKFPIMGFLLYYFLMFGIIGLKAKYINDTHKSVSQLHTELNTYAALLNKIEELKPKTDYIKELQSELKTEGDKASEALKQLASYVKALDYRLNFAFIIFADGLLLWDLQVVSKIEIWNNKHFKDLNKWFEIIAEVEVLNSMANFAYQNQDFIFPELSEEIAFSAKMLGHPAIPAQQRVCNDFSISQGTKTFIVTGANMAGKSTFLRTIGINLILAQTGSVVCAAEIRLSPMPLLTSIRIDDSLSSNESYFYAELKRLQYIISQLSDKTPALVIIDEMLRGTNSVDKHKGSEGFLRRLLQKNTITFIATHDVELGKLATEFKGQVKNYCFEAEIKNEELFFDYKLRNAISQNLNASFLMHKMGIIV